MGVKVRRPVAKPTIKATTKRVIMAITALIQGSPPGRKCSRATQKKTIPGKKGALSVPRRGVWRIKPALTEVGMVSNNLPEPIKSARILVIDDDPANLQLFDGIFREEGYSNILLVEDSREAVGKFSYYDPDFVLIDWRMPHDDGCEVLKALRYVIPNEAFTPMVVITADTSPETRRAALTAGANDFLCKPFDVVELTLRVESLLRLRFLYRSLRAEKALLEQRVRDRTRSLQQVIAELRCSSLPLFNVGI